MIIFRYRITDAMICPDTSNPIFDITITDDKKDNIKTTFDNKHYTRTLPKDAIEKIKSIIKKNPELLEIKELEPNHQVLDGDIYEFIFSDGQKSASFNGCNILDYGRQPRKNATLALRTARTIKDQVLLDYHIKTMIENRLQHWPKHPQRAIIKP